MISNGTFDDIYVGDYFTADYDGTATTFLVADIDNYYGTGYDSSSNDCKVVNGDTTDTTKCFRLQKHHITVIPATYLLVAPMNATNTTKGGYAGSDMVKTTLATVETNLKTIFGSHLIQYSNLLTTAVDDSRTSAGFGTANSGASINWTWYDRQIDLMSEMNVYGGNVVSSSLYDTGIDNRQYALFQLKPEFINQYKGYYFGWWLKNVTSSFDFAYVNSYGDFRPQRRILQSWRSPSIPYRLSTMFQLKKEDSKKLNKCIRIPESIVTEIERISKKENISFSSFVIQALEYVLKEKK